MNSEKKYSFEVWWSDIERLAHLFVDFVNNQTEDEQTPTVIEVKKLEEIKNNYYKNLKIFKKKVYGKNAFEHRIDRHKIIALYIKSILEVSPFYIKNKSKQTKSIAKSCPNECFSLEFMILVLMAWNKSKCKIIMDEQERNWFIILLNHFRLDIDTLDILSLAQIIYYIENKYISPGNTP